MMRYFYVFPAKFLLYPLVFILIFAGLLFYEIIVPICGFIEQYAVILAIVFAAVFIFVGYKFAKKKKSIKIGIGAGLSLSQLLYFVIISFFNITAIAGTDKIDLISSMGAMIFAILAFAYACFNLEMVVNSFVESKDNRNTMLVVGVIGWAINIFCTI